MKIIFDTSFLLQAAEKKRDPISQAEEVAEEKAELIVPASVLGELKSIAAGGGRQARLARIILNLIAIRKHVIASTKSAKGDGAVIELALEAGNQGVVCTNDRALKKKLRKSARIICVKKDGKIGWC